MTALLAPLACVVGMAVLPFSDRPEQLQIFGMWASYVALVGVVLL